MAVRRGQSVLLCFISAWLLSVSAQTVIPASNANQAAVTPTASYEAPGISNPTICATGDDSCSAALVQPANDTDYTNCINSPTSPNCTSSTASAAIESVVATPEEACPTDSILDAGYTEATLETQVRQNIASLHFERVFDASKWHQAVQSLRRCLIARYRWLRVSTPFVRTPMGLLASTLAHTLTGGTMSFRLLEEP